MKYIRDLQKIGLKDIGLVGGKTASLGELCSSLKGQGIRIPDGYAITADAYKLLLEQNSLGIELSKLLSDLNIDDVAELSRRGKQARTMIKQVGLPQELQDEICSAYQELSQRAGVEQLDVAVRSSATAEDLPDASFAGQHESFLNVLGEHDLCQSCLLCFASLFTDRAISYRVHHGFKHEQVKLAIVVQQMVRADLGSSGVLFTLDTESGHRNVVFITSGYGLGENIVAGKIDPDEFLVLKPTLQAGKQSIISRRVGAKQLRLIYANHGSQRTSNVEVSLAERKRLSLSDENVIKLAKWGVQIEKHYSTFHKHPTPLDIEWALDGRNNELFILQARPETVHALETKAKLVSCSLESKSRPLLKGRAVGSLIGAGTVRLIQNEQDLEQFCQGEVIVADMTSPGWEPVMKKAAAIITNRGGRTCHAAIISREIGIPCVVGTGQATTSLAPNTAVTVSCAEGETGVVYEGILPFKQKEIDLSTFQQPKTQIMLNVGNPAEALKLSLLPSAGVGLARLEFIISEHVKVHPLAFIYPEKILDAKEKENINELKQQFPPAESYFSEKLAEGVAMIAGAFYPRPVIVRFSDFKTNEYASLLGGKYFEPKEENPMIGFRGASRYYSEQYRVGFAQECLALRYVREEMGLSNVQLMIPFCRTVKEAELVIAEMAKNGLKRGENNLEIYMMCEIPSNVISIDLFAPLFDGFSIGSNDLTQLTLGIDRDSEIVSHIFDERDPAVFELFRQAIRGAKKAGIKIGICGQAPSDYPEVAQFLVKEGIDSISFSPDSIFSGIYQVLKAEEKK